MTNLGYSESLITPTPTIEGKRKEMEIREGGSREREKEEKR